MALKTTIAIINAALAADQTVTESQKKGIAAELAGTGRICGEPPPRAYSRTQVAALLGVSRKTITTYAQRGLLVPIYSGADKQRAHAYTGTSVIDLLNGKETSK